MRITELAKRTGVTTDQIRYLERKRYIRPSWVSLNRRRVREYTDNEVYKVETIIKYFDQGFRYETAYQKASEEMQSPRLLWEKVSNEGIFSMIQTNTRDIDSVFTFARHETFHLRDGWIYKGLQALQTDSSSLYQTDAHPHISR